MLTLLSEARFWTCRDEISIKDSDFGAFKYHDKREKETTEKTDHYRGKRDYAEKRGLTWSPKNKHPNKLKNAIRHFEDELRNRKVIFCEWRDHKTLELMLSTGLLVYIEINVFTGDLQRILFDKYFIGKIISESISDVIITRQHIIISYNENQITFVHLQKPSMKKLYKKKEISMADPKIFNIIIGGQTKKIARNLVINTSFDLVLIWTKSSQNEFFPWRPTIKDQERANLHIYKLNRLKLELMCFYWTENDPISVEFSKFNENEVHSVEQKISRKGDVTIESCTYKISKGKLHRVSVTSIPLQTQVCCNAFSPDHEKLMMGCIDGSIVLFDEGRGITYLVKASFIPAQVAFHPDSALIMIANERGQLQCFDISLSCVKNQLISEEVTPSNILDLSHFFTHQPALLKMCWTKKPDINNHYEKFAQTDGYLLLLLENGVFCNLRIIGGAGLKNDIHTSGLTADVLIYKYIYLNQVEKAINVLLSLNWDTYGAMCLLSLHKIANYIFKQPLTVERENQLQKAIGSFHVPVKPLCEETEVEFGDQVDDITRRFFHYLLKYKSFEKAFSLAIDINDADLFLILSKVARMNGQQEMSVEATKKAEEIYNCKSDDDHSTCSATSCSICSNSSDSGSEDNSSILSEKHAKAKPPETLPLTSEADTSGSVSEETKSMLEKRKPLKKSFSADILNHPPLPRFPRYDVKKFHQAKSETGYIPPLPFVPTVEVKSDDTMKFSKVHIPKLEVKLKASPENKKEPTTIKKRNSSLNNLTNELSFSTLPKYTFSSIDHLDGFNNNYPTKPPVASPRNSMPFAMQQHTVIDIVPNPNMPNLEIDQTLGIPLAGDSPNSSNFYASNNIFSGNFYSGPIIASPSHNGNLSDFVPTTIHQYPLISGNIPPTSTVAKMSFSPPFAAGIANLKKKEATSSILSNSNNAGNSPGTSNAPPKDGAKNKEVKFSDFITVQEISRKDKSNERLKRKSLHPMMMDPRRELAESLPLSHPNDDYLKNFTPMSDKPSGSKNGNEEKSKPTIKVVHFGVV